MARDIWSLIDGEDLREAAREEQRLRVAAEAKATRLRKALQNAVTALESHVKDAAEAHSVQPHEFCPCTENELAEAKALLVNSDDVE